MMLALQVITMSKGMGTARAQQRLGVSKASSWRGVETKEKSLAPWRHLVILHNRILYLALVCLPLLDKSFGMIVF